MKITQVLKEAAQISAAFAFGRFNPAHQGHIAVWRTVQDAAVKWYIGTNPSTLGPNDPLTFEQKSAWMAEIYPPISGHIAAEQSVMTLAAKIFTDLGKNEAASIAYITDADDWAWSGKLLNQYNGVEGKHGYYKFAEIVHVPSPRVSSATALRDAARADDKVAFYHASGTDPKLKVAGLTYFDTVKQAVTKYPLPVKKAKKVAEAVNPDILNKKFKHTQEIGDYTYTAHVEQGRSTKEPYPGAPITGADTPNPYYVLSWLKIRCFDGDKRIGSVVFEIHGNEKNQQWLESYGTSVNIAYEGTGIASTMYAYAKMLGNDIRPSKDLSFHGQRMWAGWRKSGASRELRKMSTPVQGVAEGSLNEASSDEAWELVGQPVPEIQQFVKQMGYGNDEQSIAKITSIIDRAPATQISAASIPKLKNLANKRNDAQTLKSILQISGSPDAERQYTKLMQARDAGEGRNRDVSGYIQYVKSGNYDPPVLLKLPTGVYVIGGRTRLYAALALGVPANVKIISANNFKQGVAEGAPIVVAQAPIDIRNPKKAPQPYRNQGDIVPDTKPPSTEKRGVKGRPGQRPMPTYEDNVAEASLATMRDYFAGDDNAKDPTKLSQMRDFFNKHKPEGKVIHKNFNSRASYEAWLRQQNMKKIGEDDEAGEVESKFTDYELAVMEGGHSLPEAEKIAGRYDPADFDSMVQRLGKIAKSGPMKTVWDPEKRVYKTVPDTDKQKKIAEAVIKVVEVIKQRNGLWKK